jgi:predicted oxidoreductase
VKYYNIFYITWGTGATVLQCFRKHRSLVCLLNELHVGLEEIYAVSVLLNSFSNLGAAGGFHKMMAELN